MGRDTFQLAQSPMQPGLEHAMKELKKFEIPSCAIFLIPLQFLEQLKNSVFTIQLASKQFYLVKILANFIIE